MKPIFEFHYKWRLGAIAWLLHRLSGLALIAYLCLHIYVIHNLAYGREHFDAVMKFLGSPLFKTLEIGLIGVILYHAFNGLRVIIIDFWGGTRIQKKLFIIMMAVAALLFIAGAARIASHLFGAVH